MNATELAAVRWLEERELVVFRAGWPDLLVYDDATESYHGLEIKSPSDKLSTCQATMHFHLEEVGLPVFTAIATPDAGIVSVDRYAGLKQARHRLTPAELAALAKVAGL